MDYLGTLQQAYGMYANNKATNDAASAARKAAQLQAVGQGNALDYLKAADFIPMQFRDQSLQRVGGLYGLEGGIGSQEEMITAAQQSPLYNAMMGSKKAGEESILRNASATGGLRSGNTQHALYDYNTQFDNNALLASYKDQLGGLRGLAGLQGNQNSIAKLMEALGITAAGGELGASRAKQAGAGNLLSGLTGGGTGGGVDLTGLLSGIYDNYIGESSFTDAMAGYGGAAGDWAGDTWDAGTDWIGDIWSGDWW